MLCAQCAMELESGTVLCTYCGAAAIATQPSSFTGAGSAGALPFSTPMFASANALEGIGGWLILVAIGLVVSPIFVIGRTSTVFVPLLSNRAALSLLEAHPAMRTLILFEIVTNVIFVLFLLALNFLFYTKRRSFPSSFISFLALQLLLILGDTILAHVLLPSVPISRNAVGALGRSIVGCAIWIPYMLVSQRVKATFVR